MKSIFLIIIFIIIHLSCFAQEQMGFVKTISRSQRPGQYLGNVILNIGNHRNRILSDSITGEFRFDLSSDEVLNGFSIKGVTKRGYALQNVEDLRQYPYSPNIVLPIYMYSISERMQEEELIKERSLTEMRKKYNQLVIDLRNKETDLMILNNKISELQSKFNNCELLLNELASIYSSVNYDNLSPVDSLINTYIEIGEIEAADSLLNLKDDLEFRYNTALRVQQASSTLSAYSQNITSEVVNDYWIKFYNSYINFKFDECCIYLERISNLKPNNFELQKNVSYFYILLGDYSKVIPHLKNVFEISEKNNDRFFKASAFQLNAIYNVYLGLYDDALLNIIEALKVYDIDLSLILEDPESYTIKTSSEENDPYVIYYNKTGLNIKDITIILELTALFSSISSTIGHINEAVQASFFSYNFVNSNIEKSSLITVIIGLSSTFTNIGLFPMAEQFLEIIYTDVKDLQEYRYVSTIIELILINTKFRIKGKELEAKILADKVFESVNDIGEQNFNPALLINYYISLSNAYQSNSIDDKSFDFLKKAEQVYLNHNLNQESFLFTIYNNTGQLHYKNKEYLKAISYFEKAQNFTSNNDLQESMLYFNLGQNYRELGDSVNLLIALDYLNKSLDIREKLYNEGGTPSHYLFESYFSLASLYYELKKGLNAFNCYEKAFEVSKELYGEKKYETLRSLTNAYQVLYRERYLYPNDTIIAKYKEFTSNINFIVSPKRKDALDFYYLIAIDDTEDFSGLNPISIINTNKSCRIKYLVNDEITILNDEDIDQYGIFVIKK